MKSIKILLAVFLLTGLVACDEDFLDVKPTNSGDSETSIQTPADAEVIINGLMSKMRSSAYYGRNFIMYANAKGGDLTIFSQGRGLDGLYTFNHSATTGSYSGYWNQIYHCILQANSILESIEKLQSEGSTGDFDESKGQALTARALMYFDLVRLYGEPYSEDKSALGVPNVVKPLDASAQPLRATVEENYNQILADLQTAAPLMSKSKSNGYLNYYANLAMQARVNLYMGNHTEALAAAEEIINSGEYSLYSNNEWVDSWTMQFGSESIFELAILPTEGDLGTSSLGFYLRRKGHGSGSAAGWFMASDYFLDRLGEDPEDVRWGVMSYDEVSEDHLGASYKYSGSTDLVGDGKSTGTAVNIKVIRLSEIYLIAAEAALPVDKGLAADYLNEIRKRSPSLDPATESTISVDMILDERSKELFTEGHRFFDMMRLNKSITYNDDLGGIAVTNRDKTIDRSFYKTILPISQSEINANPDIEKQQNPGY
ncbi:RagB/SusD family nutrient uptake outer membrane protein [Membranicola marinus]|uniref:RagB/SusD family nutrient uptake outer membrane protein n=1 Tax=Membranihabitans marinus TaxID=1227546 RepID=A0A953HVU9_9BACT|nr:RagB/SusD family nutrient uptake outer membrane protein [Membranihabitans marinus]MBY5959420.1 RagB/SusD family nutrient uptake outer membrane protein [Membranihabitans marinus]